MRKLLCVGKEVEPIQPAKATTAENVHYAFVNVTGAPYIDFYFSPPGRDFALSSAGFSL